jgi:hypothetical protein
MMPAAWLSTISPADAARKKMTQSRQNTGRRRSSSLMRAPAAAAARVTPDRAVSHALTSPRSARTAANHPSAARTPMAGIAHPKTGAAIIAPAGRRLTR